MPLFFDPTITWKEAELGRFWHVTRARPTAIKEPITNARRATNRKTSHFEASWVEMYEFKLKFVIRVYNRVYNMKMMGTLSSIYNVY